MSDCYPVKPEKAGTLFIEMQCIFHTYIINETVAPSMLSGRFCFHDDKNSSYLDPVCSSESQASSSPARFFRDAAAKSVIPRKSKFLS